VALWNALKADAARFPNTYPPAAEVDGEFTGLGGALMSQTNSPESFDSTLENAAAEATLRSSGYALLIGIEAYRSFDAQGRFDLPAGRNDVLAFYRVARKLGFSANRIRVLTTPLLEPRQLMEMERLLDPTAKEDDLEQRISGVERREATRQEILDGERWLADKLTAKQVQGAHPLGLMTYSGHGSRLGNELDLCPSDVGPNLENAIDFSELRRILQGEPAEHLTIVLDCCFAEKEFDRQRGPFKLSYLPVPRAGSAAPASPAEDAPLARLCVIAHLLRRRAHGAAVLTVAHSGHAQCLIHQRSWMARVRTREVYAHEAIFFPHADGCGAGCDVDGSFIRLCSGLWLRHRRQPEHDAYRRRYHPACAR
jgi:hypothetical protein